MWTKHCLLFSIYDVHTLSSARQSNQVSNSKRINHGLCIYLVPNVIVIINNGDFSPPTATNESYCFTFIVTYLVNGIFLVFKNTRYIYKTFLTQLDRWRNAFNTGTSCDRKYNPHRIDYIHHTGCINVKLQNKQDCKFRFLQNNLSLIVELFSFSEVQKYKFPNTILKMLTQLHLTV